MLGWSQRHEGLSETRWGIEWILPTHSRMKYEVWLCLYKQHRVNRTGTDWLQTFPPAMTVVFGCSGCLNFFSHLQQPPLRLSPYSNAMSPRPFSSFASSQHLSHCFPRGSHIVLHCQFSKVDAIYKFFHLVSSLPIFCSGFIASHVFLFCEEGRLSSRIQSVKSFVQFCQFIQLLLACPSLSHRCPTHTTHSWCMSRFPNGRHFFFNFYVFCFFCVLDLLAMRRYTDGYTDAQPVINSDMKGLKSIGLWPST